MSSWGGVFHSSVAAWCDIVWFLCHLMDLQIRQAVTEFGILPLGSQINHERLPHIKTLLLYGAPKTGKTMLAHVSTALQQ